MIAGLVLSVVCGVRGQPKERIARPAPAEASSDCRRGQHASRRDPLGGVPAQYVRPILWTATVLHGCSPPIVRPS